MMNTFFLFLFPIFLIALIFIIKERPKRVTQKSRWSGCFLRGFFLFWKKPKPSEYWQCEAWEHYTFEWKSCFAALEQNCCGLALAAVNAVPRISSIRGDAARNSARNSVIGRIMAEKCNERVISICVLSKVDNFSFLPQSRWEEDE